MKTIPAPSARQRLVSLVAIAATVLLLAVMASAPGCSSSAAFQTITPAEASHITELESNATAFGASVDRLPVTDDPNAPIRADVLAWIKADVRTWTVMGSWARGEVDAFVPPDGGDPSQ